MRELSTAEALEEAILFVLIGGESPRRKAEILRRLYREYEYAAACERRDDGGE